MSERISFKEQASYSQILEVADLKSAFFLTLRVKDSSMLIPRSTLPPIGQKVLTAG